MASAPPSKKRKVETAVKAAIVFQAPGLKPDVCLKVFDQEYHVHSVLLKLHSVFFRKFLYAPDKGDVEKVAAAGFRYVWVTEVDENGKSWHLVTDLASKLKTPKQPVEFVNHIQYEQEAFRKLLCAIYTQPYTFVNTAELIKVTSIADYYRALPILSRTLDGALVNSKYIDRQISQDCHKLLETATKLRNALLFRECLVWVVSPWSKREALRCEIRDPKLKKCTFIAYRHVGKKVADLQHSIMNFIAMCSISKQENSIPPLRELRDFIDASTVACYDRPRKSVFLPKYFRLLLESGNFWYISTPLFEVCANSLVLSQKTFMACEEAYKDNFFCAEIADEDLPWDINEKEW